MLTGMRYKALIVLGCGLLVLALLSVSDRSLLQYLAGGQQAQKHDGVGEHR